MRKSMKKLIALTLACLMLATLFVGCGKKDDGKKCFEALACFE